MDEKQVETDIKTADPGLTDTIVRVRENTGGGKVAQLNVPVEVAARLAESEPIKVGWSLCRVKLLERKQPLCYNCQERGHYKAECTVKEVKKRCFRCRQTDHLIADCPGRPRAPQPRSGPPKDGESGIEPRTEEKAND